MPSSMCEDVARDSSLTSRNRGRHSTPLQTLNRIRYNQGNLCVVAIGIKTVVVVPNWNGLDFLADCLNSLVAQSEPNFSITVVDNGSTDGSRELVQNQYPSVKLILREKNYGFTGGTNPGMQDAIACGAQYVALLNNDAVADKN